MVLSQTHHQYQQVGSHRHLQPINADRGVCVCVCGRGGVGGGGGGDGSDADVLPCLKFVLAIDSRDGSAQLSCFFWDSTSGPEERCIHVHSQGDQDLEHVHPTRKSCHAMSSWRMSGPGR